MSEFTEANRAEVENNYIAFAERLSEYSVTHPEKFALMRGGEIIEFYDGWEDAYRTGIKFYEDGVFSVQQVTPNVVDLGFFSHAVHIG